MKSQGYTSFQDRSELKNKDGLNYCSRESSERPIVVNSSGSFNTESEFTSDNPTGRLDFYLMYIEQGTLTVRFPEEDKVLSAGTVLLIPPKTPYRYSHKSGDRINYLWTHFTGSHAKAYLDNYGLKIYPEYNVITHDSILTTRYRNIFEAFASNDSFRDNELSLLFERLLISLGRRLGKNQNSDNRILSRSVAYINMHYKDEIRIPELAEMESISVSRYNTLFRKIMNCSPTEYIAKMRTSSACDLLLGTDLSVKEIGEMVGYSDPHFFSKIFKSRTGASPKGYRRGE